MSMFRGVKNSGKSADNIHLNSAETCHDETHPPHFTESEGKSPEFDVSIGMEKREPFIYPEPTKSGQFMDCTYWTLRKLTVKILLDQNTASLIEKGEIGTVIMDGITPEKAKALVANDSHWTPDHTADRILSFAMTISGNDLDKFDIIKESIVDGFESVEETFGGKLPELTGKTLTAVLNRLEEWAVYGGNSASLLQSS